MAALQDDGNTLVFDGKTLNMPSENTLRTALADDANESVLSLPVRQLVESFVDDGTYAAVRSKEGECRQIMADLATMTQRAVAAFSDLNSLRASISLPPAPPAAGAAFVPQIPHVPVDDALLCDFRASVNSLSSLLSIAGSGRESLDTSKVENKIGFRDSSGNGGDGQSQS